LQALVISNMAASKSQPERGSFVRTQVAALRQLPGLEVELFEFPPGARALAKAAATLLWRYRGHRFDVVHAHFGLAAWPALCVSARVRALTLHGSELAYRRTRLATQAVLPLIDLPAAASAELAEAAPPARRPYAILPCGVDLQRLVPKPRPLARQRLGLPLGEPYLLFPADPRRPEKRYDRALALAGRLDCKLLVFGGIPPERVVDYYNAANAVVIPSEREGFGLAALEGLACNLPVAATPVGNHPHALAGLESALCAPFDLESWAAFLRPYLEAEERRPTTRDRAAAYSAVAMAEQVADRWREAVAQAEQNWHQGG